MKYLVNEYEIEYSLEKCGHTNRDAIEDLFSRTSLTELVYIDSVRHVENKSDLQRLGKALQEFCRAFEDKIIVFEINYEEDISNVGYQQARDSAEQLAKLLEQNSFVSVRDYINCLYGELLLWSPVTNDYKLFSAQVDKLTSELIAYNRFVELSEMSRFRDACYETLRLLNRNSRDELLSLQKMVNDFVTETASAIGADSSTAESLKAF